MPNPLQAEMTEIEVRVSELEDRLRKLTDFARAHEKLEASILTDGGSWVEEMFEQFQPEFEKVQKLRNDAIGS